MGTHISYRLIANMPLGIMLFNNLHASLLSHTVFTQWNILYHVHDSKSLVWLHMVLEDNHASLLSHMYPMEHTVPSPL